jgi:hypothetical protein
MLRDADTFFRNTMCPESIGLVTYLDSHTRGFASEAGARGAPFYRLLDYENCG